MPKDKFKEGDVFKVNLPSGYVGFGKVLPTSFAFFDYFKTQDEEWTLEDILDAPVAFKIWVSYFALNNGVWKIIGNLAIPEDRRGTVFFYKQDPISNELWKTVTGAEEYAVSLDE